jgi:hypothetical protein
MKSKLESQAKSLRSQKKIKWDNKWYTPGELIILLAKEVHRLRKQKCKPGTSCLFKYEDYLDKIYGRESGTHPLGSITFPDSNLQ